MITFFILSHCEKLNSVHCPNHPTCQLINQEGFLDDEGKKNQYIERYCTDPHGMWASCKRFQTHKSLNFCPDFVFPDSALTIDEIIDRFDNEINPSNSTNHTYGDNGN